MFPCGLHESRYTRKSREVSPSWSIRTMNPLAWVAIALGVLGVAGSAVAFVVGRRTGRDTEVWARKAAGDTAEELVKRMIGDADGLRKQSVLAGKEEAMRAREEWEAEARRRREEVEREEKRIQERENVLDRKFDLVETRDKDVGKRASDLGGKEKSVEERQQELDKMVGEERRRLEQLAGLSAAEAK